MVCWTIGGVTHGSLETLFAPVCAVRSCHPKSLLLSIFGRLRFLILVRIGRSCGPYRSALEVGKPFTFDCFGMNFWLYVWVAASRNLRATVHLAASKGAPPKFPPPIRVASPPPNSFRTPAYRWPLIANVVSMAPKEHPSNPLTPIEFTSGPIRWTKVRGPARGIRGINRFRRPRCTPPPQPLIRNLFSLISYQVIPLFRHQCDPRHRHPKPNPQVKLQPSLTRLSLPLTPPPPQVKPVLFHLFSKLFLARSHWLLDVPTRAPWSPCGRQCRGTTAMETVTGKLSCSEVGDSFSSSSALLLVAGVCQRLWPISHSVVYTLTLSAVPGLAVVFRRLVTPVEPSQLTLGIFLQPPQEPV